MKTITTIALIAAALLSACGGGDDEQSAGPVDVWQVPTSGATERATCSASITPTKDTSIKVTVRASRTLTVAAGTLGLRSYVVYGAGSQFSMGVREGAAKDQPVQADVSDFFWATAKAGQPFTASAYVGIRGQVEPGAVVTTTACSVDLAAA